MGGSLERMIFVLGFVLACIAFRMGVRHIRRVPAARTRRDALRLAYQLSLALLVGCSGAGRGSGATTTATTATTDGGRTVGTTGLGAEADAAWAELAALWDESGTYQEGEVTSDTLQAARGKLDGLLARLGGIAQVGTDAPGLVALLRIEFLARLELRPADVLCYEPAPPRTPAGEAYDRLAARADAVVELAAKGYVNDWLREHVLARLHADADEVRAAMAAGDDWRTEDWHLRQVDPAEARALLERIDAALAALAGP